MSLTDFFAHTQKLLLGQIDVQTYERTLGHCSSGPHRLQYYRTLIRRNMMKVLRDMYPSVRARYLQQHPHGWSDLVDEFTAAHPPPAHWDPNRFAEPFADFLAKKRQADPTLPADLEQLADFHWTEFQVFSASQTWPEELGPDGLEHRLYVRQYEGKIPAYARELVRDPSAQPPEPTPTPALIYRNLHTHQLQVFYPNVLALLVLSKRSGKQLPDIPGLTPENLEIAEKNLVERGILTREDTKQN